MGHLQMIREHIQSTQPKQRAPKMESPRSKKHKVGIFSLDLSKLREDEDLRNLIASDLPGRYPVTSGRGHNYIFIMYDYDSNLIWGIPLTSRKTECIMAAFEECYSTLRKQGFQAITHRLDNEVSNKFTARVEKEGLDYQLASPGNHRLNQAE